MRSASRCLLTALVLLFSISAVAQTTASAATPTAKTQASQPAIKKVPATYTNPSSGRQMFDAYCASCHGQGGKGNGPAAAALKVPPTDLTQLAAQHGGKFPENHVAQVIKGDSQTASHGNKEMPVWGPVFLSLSQQDPGVEQLRIRNLTNYVQGMQQKK